LDHIFPASWINANFDVWIGAEEDNQAWMQLLRARQTFDQTTAVPEEQRRMAFEELLISEGSDWCWWYGPEHDSANRAEFDQLYRSHLANVYRFLNLAPPEELSRPILRVCAPEVHIEPTAPITPVIDGEVTSYFEWMGAGVYRVDERSGSMHGKTVIVKEVHFGSDGVNFYLRVDFQPGREADLAGLEARLTVESPDGAHSGQTAISLLAGLARVRSVMPDGLDVECVLGRVAEARVSLKGLGIAAGSGVRFQFSIWQDGLPLDSVPQQGWLEMPTTNPAELVA
jgi:hypothetical protein